jgi:hypothetical protein
VWRRTDVTKPIVAFRDFAKAPEHTRVGAEWYEGMAMIR